MAATVAGCVGLARIAVTLQDAFEVVLLPRRIRRRLRLTSIFFRATWIAWASAVSRMGGRPRREHLLVVYGPLAIACLFGLWATRLIAGFGQLQWARAYGHDASDPIASRLFMRGDAFFTLGYGDIVALTLSALPVLYQHFAPRDVQLIQLAPRAGSPASGATPLLRCATASGPAVLESWLRGWEIWAAGVRGSHASRPMLAYHRSQHRHQSRPASPALIPDCCALIVAYGGEGASLQACAAMATARRYLDETVESLGLAPAAASLVPFPDAGGVSHLVGLLARSGLARVRHEEADILLAELGDIYEGYLAALSGRLLLPLPPRTAEDVEPPSRLRAMRQVLRR